MNDVDSCGSMILSSHLFLLILLSTICGRQLAENLGPGQLSVWTLCRVWCQLFQQSIKTKTRQTGSFYSDVKPRISLPMLILRRLALPGHTTWNWCKHTCGLIYSKWNGRILRRDTCKEQLLWMIPRRRMRRGRRRRGEAKLCCERRWNTTAMPHSVTWLRLMQTQYHELADEKRLRKVPGVRQGRWVAGESWILIEIKQQW